MTWAILYTERTDTPHIVPVDDLRDHDAERCWCCPSWDEGVLVHHSMDLREEFERGDRLAS